MTSGEAKVVWDGKDASGAYDVDGEYKHKSEGGIPVNGAFYRLVKAGPAPQFVAIVNYATHSGLPPVYDSDLATETVAYGNRVRTYVQQLSQNTSGFPWLFYMVHEDENISRETVRKLCKWLRTTVDSVYWDGHGSRTPEGNSFHRVALGGNIHFYNSGAVRSGWQDITAQHWVGARQYRFVFFATCHSAGSNRSDNPQDCWLFYPPQLPPHGTYMTRFPHSRWAEVFNVDTEVALEGAFIGFNGQSFYSKSTGIGKAWRDWKDFYWQALASGNYSVEEALARADQLLPSFAAKPNPESYCSGAINQPKRHQAGDWRW